MYNCYLYAYDLNEQRRLEQGQHILKGERQLRPEDIRFGDDVEEMNEHLLNFYMEGVSRPVRPLPLCPRQDRASGVPAPHDA